MPYAPGSWRAAPPWAFVAATLALTGWPVTSAAQPSVKGQWGPVMDWPNVAIHVHVLPNGKVLFWGRREWNADGTPKESLDVHNCTPRIWDPQTGTFTTMPQPGYNLFCAGHTFLADGRLLVVGGHDKDGQGKPHARIFDHTTSTWTAIPDMNAGRWYPTATALPDGGVLVSSGGDELGQRNVRQQIWKNGVWLPMQEYNDIPLYPRMHVTRDGKVCMSGYLQRTVLLNMAAMAGAGSWEEVGYSTGAQREEGTAAMYDVDKVLIVGGGVNPQKTAERLDLTAMHPAWQPAASMSTERRHLNATILPDGTVLVTGGTSGGGFNDVTKPVKHAEVWVPATNQWTSWEAEAMARLYHSTAALLPDGRVLSAGGGEYRLTNGDPNPNGDSLRNAQLFSPPYLFKSTAMKPRPDITSVPAAVSYGETFDVGTTRPDQVARVTWIRLSSVTHSFNMGQRFNALSFTAEATKLKVTAPANANVCPPGHYMLFVLNDDKVPSVANIIRIN
jgi:galactose oxidase